MLRRLEYLPPGASMRHVIEEIGRVDDMGVPRFMIVDALRSTPYKCSPTTLSSYLYRRARARKLMLSKLTFRSLAEDSVAN